MTDHKLTRRALIAGPVAAAAVAALPDSAQASGFRRITVDVGPLRAQGLGQFAGFVQSNLQAALARAFAGRAGGAGPSLVVRITGVSLNAFAGPDSVEGRFGGGGTANSDYMEGEALVVSGSQVVLRHPQLAVLPASGGGAWYVAGHEMRRTAALCEAYAQWLARSL